MPGIELSGERRLLTLWLILTIVIGGAYYRGLSGREPFVQRFERAYYAVFWSRPLLSTGAAGLDVGIITPNYVSSLIDTEMWIWVRNQATPTSAAGGASGAGSDGDTGSNNEAVASPLVVVSYTSDIKRTPKGAAPANGRDAAAQAPEPENPNPIEAQMLLRQGDSSTDMYTQSSSTITFSDVYPGETAARLVWVRLMPQAYQKEQGELSEAIYLAENEITGTVSFKYHLWQAPGQYSSELEFEGPPPLAVIDTWQALMRGFARTLLLPPWSNGLLLGLALITAFLLNMVITFIDQKLMDDHMTLREDLYRKALAERVYVPYEGSKGSWIWWAAFLVLRGLFWMFAVATAFLLVARLTEGLVLCDLLTGPEAAVAEAAQGAAPADCVQWPLRPWFFITLPLAAVIFYLGYLWKDIPIKELRQQVANRIEQRRIRQWRIWQWRIWQWRIWQWRREQMESQEQDESPPRQEDPPHDPGTADAAPPGNADEQRHLEPDPDQETTAQAKKVAARVHKLYREIETLRQSPPLAVTEVTIRNLRAQQGRLENEVGALPAAVWQRRRACEKLTATEGLLDQLESYHGLAERANELIARVKRGEEGALIELHRLQKELVDSGRPYDTEPSLTLSRALADELDRANKYYKEHFENFSRGVINDSKLVAALKKMDRFRRQEGNNVYVRFFTNDVDVNDTECADMLLITARDIGLKRLSRYRMQKYQEKRNLFEALQKKKTSTAKQKEEAKRALQRWLDVIKEWPHGLPGWAEFPEPDAVGDEQPVVAQIVQLRAEIEAEIERRLT